MLPSKPAVQLSAEADGSSPVPSLVFTSVSRTDGRSWFWASAVVAAASFSLAGGN